MEWVGFGGKGRVSELLPVPLPHPHCQELTAGVISDLWPVGPSCWGGRGSCSRLSGTHVRDTSHGMAPVQLFPLGSRGRSCCQAGSQYELREGCRLPAPSRTHLATAEAQSSAGSMNPPGSPLNRGLADPSGCLGVLAQPCRMWFSGAAPHCWSCHLIVTEHGHTPGQGPRAKEDIQLFLEPRLCLGPMPNALLVCPDRTCNKPVRLILRVFP